MKSDSIAYTVAGICFGVILGWVIGTQQVARSAAQATVPTAAQQTATPPTTTGNQRQPPPLDQSKVQALTTILNSDPKNAGALVQLANVYFDAEQYAEAIKYYQQSLTIDPRNPDASTDLGVSYYYTNRTDDALKQFEASLRMNPTHTKTLLNQGIVLAFGKQDLDGASAAWRKVVELAPGSPEAQAAQRGLEGIAAARPGTGGTAPADKS